MKNLIEWIKAIRPLASLTGFITSMASFALTYHYVGTVALLFSIDCFSSMAATMAMNDFMDRDYDKLKGKTFAYDNPKIFRRFVICLWIIELISIFGQFLIDWRLGCLTLLRAILGFTYSWTRHIPLLPLIMIGLVVFTGAITPAILSSANLVALSFSIAILLLIVGRDCGHKDVTDYNQDLSSGGKYTIATIWGPNIAGLAARVMIVIALLILISIPLAVLPKVGAIGAMISMSLFGFSAYLIQGKYFPKSKLLLDGGIALLLLTINSSYWSLYYLPPLRSIDLSQILQLVAIVATIMSIFICKSSIKILANIIESGIDHGEESLQKRGQSRYLWPIMYFLFWLVTVSCRTFAISKANWAAINLQSLKVAMSESTIVSLILIGLITSQIPHIQAKNRSRGYTIIERMIIGLLIGFFCGWLACMGLKPYWMAIGLPLVSIYRPELQQLRDLIKSYGCIFGIFTAVMILDGISYSLHYIAPSYLFIVAIYFFRCYKYRLPVYIPNIRYLRKYMSKIFVKEVRICGS